MPSIQIEKVTSYLGECQPQFPKQVQKLMEKFFLGGKDRAYVTAIETYAKEAHHLTVPVNVWLIPYPTGHNAVVASVNELSLAASWGRDMG